MRLALMCIPVLLCTGCSDSGGPVKEDGNPDLDAIAQLIDDNKLSENDFLEMGLSNDEIRDLVFKVGILRGAAEDTFEQEIYGDAPEAPLLRGACTQDVEKANLSGDTYSSTHFNDTWCDADGSDVDWLYEFYPSWADNSDNYRWYASDWWIRTTFDTVYSGKLTGYTLCSSPVGICLGTNGVTAAGGATAVANNLFISH